MKYKAKAMNGEWVYENFDADFSKEIEQELEWRLAESNDIARSFMWGGDY